MSTYTNYFNSNNLNIETVWEIAKSDCISVKAIKEGEPGICGEKEKMAKLSFNALQLLAKGFENPMNAAEMYTIIQVVKSGPKIFCPTQTQFSILEQMELNIPIEEYNQPFPTLILELPKEYRKTKKIELSLENKVKVNSLKNIEPLMVIVHFDQEYRLMIFLVLFDNFTSTKTSFVFKEGEAIENLIMGATTKMRTSGFDDQEISLQLEMIRSAMNYSLLLDEVGVKKIGPENDHYYNKLISYRDKANKKNNTDQVRALSKQIKAHPIMYSLNQDVVLYKTVNHHSELPGNNTGRTMPPHHRRGFYKLQPHGPGNSLRKRIRIPAVFVNKYLFLGDMKDSITTYH